MMTATNQPDRDIKIYNETRDDLESFVWVFCYALMRNYFTKNKMVDADGYRTPASVRFEDMFGGSSLDGIYGARCGAQPLDMAAFKSGISVGLREWLDHFMSYRLIPPLYHVVRGFEFNHDSLQNFFDEALAAATSRG